MEVDVVPRLITIIQGHVHSGASPSAQFSLGQASMASQAYTACWSPSYSPVLAFMVAGTLCCEFMTADIPTPYSVPGTKSVGRCRNQHYSVCVSVVGEAERREAGKLRFLYGSCV